MANKEIEADILRDIPIIYSKIEICNGSIKYYEDAILKEKVNIEELNTLIKNEEEKIVLGLKKFFDIASLQNNISRCLNNIKTFNTSIVKEQDTIDKFKKIIEVLQEDLKRPKEIQISFSKLR